MNKILKDIYQYKTLSSIVPTKIMLLAVFAKLPYTMLVIGILITVKYVTGSIVTAGFSTAFLSFATAFSSLIISKYFDLKGTRFTAFFVIPFNVLSLVFLFCVLWFDLSRFLIYFSCVLIGCSIVPIGSVTRSLWIRRSNSHIQTQLALSYESSVDEFLYVLGPALVGIIASVTNGFVLLGIIVVLIILFPTIFIYHLPENKNTVHLKSSSENISIISTLKAVYLPMLSICSVGIFFGSMQVSITEIASNYGSPSYAGLSYATIGISSSIAAMLLVLLPVSFKLWDRQILFSGLLFLATLPCVFISSLPWVTFFLLVLGSFIGPCLVTAFAVGEFMAKGVSIPIAMASISSSIIVGNSIGSSLAAKVAFIYDGNISIIVSLSACILCMLLGFIIKMSVRK